jgi:ferritin
MLISREMNDAINGQIGREFGASLQYVNIATYFDSQDLPKLAGLFYKQAEEERDHAMKFVKYLVDTGAEVHIPPVDAPKSSFVSAEEAVELSVKWEMDVTRYINGLMDLALDQRDYATQEFLGWFVTEQVEEVSSMERLLNVIRRAGEHNLLMIEAYISHL